MEAAVRDFSQRSEHIYSDSTVVVVMSHGGPDGIDGVSCDETDVFPVEKIFYYLNTKNCPRLKDKPKIILIQACRGGIIYVVKCYYKCYAHILFLCILLYLN